MGSNTGAGWTIGDGTSGVGVSMIIKRLLSLGLKGFPMTHVTSAMIQIPMGRAFREIREGNPYV